MNFKLALSICDRVRDDLLRTNETSKIIEILKFHPKLYPDNKNVDNPSDESTGSKSFFIDIVLHSSEILIDEGEVTRLRKEVQDQLDQEAAERLRFQEAVRLRGQLC